MKYFLKAFLLIIIQLNFYNIYAQTKLTDTLFKYFIGTNEPDSTWKMINYNDTSWSTGSYSIGYGDGDDATLIDTAVAVYLRYNIEISNKEQLNELCLYVDFDDAFAAYLNGIEIARVNLGKHNSPTSSYQLADRSHETENYRHMRSTVQGYYIDNYIVSQNMVLGDNILAIEVHNDSLKGSDLSFSCDLVNTFGDYNMYNPYHRYKKSIELDSTSLPIIKIESGEMGIPVKRIEVPATITIINEVNSFNKPDDKKTEYSGPISIEVRGESSADFPKQSFDFETLDKFGNDSSISLLGLPKESDWILFGPFADKSQIRNAMIYELARKTGHWTPRTVFCEVIINGEYVGLYNLTEKIKRDSARINISKLDSNDTGGMQVTGGYIVKYDKGNSGLQIVYPKETDLLPEQYNYIVSFFNKYNLTVNSKRALDPETGFKTMIDYNSLIDYIIIAELGKNCDSYLYSSYLHKDRDDKNGRLNFGPIWDFDLCFGNAIWQQGDRTYGWQFEYPNNNKFQIKQLFIDTSLVNLFEERWFELRKQFLHTDSLRAMIDNLSTSLEAPLQRNYTVWPVITKDLFWPAYKVQSYYHETEYIKTWIDTRTQWIDENISKIFYKNPYPTSVSSTSFAQQAEITIYPNPFTNQINIDLKLEKESEISINLISVNGQVEQITSSVKLIPGKYNILWKDNNELLPGLYIVEIIIDNNIYNHSKVLKLY